MGNKELIIPGEANTMPIGEMEIAGETEVECESYRLYGRPNEDFACIMLFNAIRPFARSDICVRMGENH